MGSASAQNIWKISKKCTSLIISIIKHGLIMVQQPICLGTYRLAKDTNTTEQPISLGTCQSSPFYPEPRPRDRPRRSWKLVDQQQAAANRLGSGAYLLSRGDLAKMLFTYENLQLNEMRCS